MIIGDGIDDLSETRQASHGFSSRTSCGLSKEGAKGNVNVESNRRRVNNEKCDRISILQLSNAFASIDSQSSSQPEYICLFSHGTNDSSDVFLEGNPQEIGARLQILALDAAGKCLVLHPLLHRSGLQVENAFAGANQRR